MMVSIIQRAFVFILFLLVTLSGSSQSEDKIVLPEQNLLMADAPIVIVARDDHVATVEMDFDPGSSYQLWNVGTDGLDPVGFRLQWWLDASEIPNVVAELGCSSNSSLGTLHVGTEASPYQIVSTNPIVQIQPLANNVTYHLKVEKLNGFGQICSAPTVVTFEGGDSTRVSALRNELTFFDDFNLPIGLPDELKWNNAMTPQTDPRFNLFFINPQCHVHTLTGTLTDAAGDKAQVAQRARKPVLIEEGVRRKIVFDMDGIFSPRGVWYLDLLPVKSDLTGHMSFFDQDGDTGLPADVLRLKSKNNDIFVHLINSAGELYNVASAHLPDFDRRLSINVRRAFDVRLGTDGIEIFVDGTSVLSANFTPGTFKPGSYDLLWSTIGYNTSKDDNPYFLSHWDNFGFDGPNIEPYHVHNYVTRINGTDLQKSNRRSETFPVFTIEVPDDIRPVESGVTNEVYLVFTYLKNDFSSFNIEEGDYFTFNGISYLLPEGANNTNPLVPDLVNYAGSTISNRIKIGEVQKDGVSPLNIGANAIQFFAENTGIVNVHIEVMCPESATPPPYTPPGEIHPFNLHGDLPKLGTPARVVHIDNQGISSDEDGNLSGPAVSGVVPVEVRVGNDSWAGWAPELLRMPASSAQFWSVGSTPGIEKVELYLRQHGVDSLYGIKVAELHASVDAPAPQLRYTFNLDTRQVVNGTYDLYVMATDAKGVKSHPAYSGFAFKWDASEIAGAYYPIEITISNPVFAEYIFDGTDGNSWTTNTSWQSGIMPPLNYDGSIKILSDCEVPNAYKLTLRNGATLEVKAGVELRIKD